MADDYRDRVRHKLLAIDDRDPDSWLPVLDAVTAAHQQWEDEHLAGFRAELGSADDPADAWIKRATDNLRAARWQRHRAEAAERKLAEAEAGLPEWRCPNCGATTRARPDIHRDGESERKLAVVRELHRPYNRIPSRLHCRDCEHTWPCPTVRILDAMPDRAALDGDGQ